MFNSLFHFNNDVTFFFYPHLITLYVLSLVLAVTLFIYKKRTTLKYRELKATLRHLSHWLFIYGFIGLFLLFCRYGYVYFLSMEFLHILNFLFVVPFLTYYIYHFAKLNDLKLTGKSQ